jgi:hypothetical protein
MPTFTYGHGVGGLDERTERLCAPMLGKGSDLTLAPDLPLGGTLIPTVAYAPHNLNHAQLCADVGEILTTDLDVCGFHIAPTGVALARFHELPTGSPPFQERDETSAQANAH